MAIQVMVSIRYYVELSNLPLIFAIADMRQAYLSRLRRCWRPGLNCCQGRRPYVCALIVRVVALVIFAELFYALKCLFATFSQKVLLQLSLVFEFIPRERFYIGTFNCKFLIFTLYF